MSHKRITYHPPERDVVQKLAVRIVEHLPEDCLENRAAFVQGLTTHLLLAGRILARHKNALQEEGHPHAGS